MQDLFKEHSETRPINSSMPPANNPLNRFENTNQNLTSLSDILHQVDTLELKNGGSAGIFYETPFKKVEEIPITEETYDKRGKQM